MVLRIDIETDTTTKIQTHFHSLKILKQIYVKIPSKNAIKNIVNDSPTPLFIMFVQGFLGLRFHVLLYHEFPEPCPLQEN